MQQDLKNIQYDSKSKLGLIAGSGNFPERVRQAVIQQGGEIFILGIEGFVDEALPCTDIFNIISLDKFITTLKEANCHQVVLVGGVIRPSLEDILEHQAHSDGEIRGDSSLSNQVIEIFNISGLQILPVQSVVKDLLPPAGYLTQHKPNKTDLLDINSGMRVTQIIGDLDIGQASVVCGRQVLAVEGVDGTDALLKRIAGLDESLRGTEENRRGVLIKLPKRQQPINLDFPAIGITTIENAAKACLSGIVCEAQGVIVDGLEECIQRANELNIFLYCVPREVEEEDR